MYYTIDRIIPAAASRTSDYTVDEKAHTVDRSPTRASSKVEKLLGIDNLYDPSNIETACTTSSQALRAHTLYKRDVDYVVKDGEVLIVDEFTGRLMPGRRWSRRPAPGGRGQGRRQIENENQTLATITFQNYFRMYKKLAGMTGTADTEAAEFAQDLQARRRGDPDQPADDPHGLRRRRLQDRAREVRRGRRGDRRAATSRASRSWSARSPSRSPSGSPRCSRSAGIPHDVLNAKHHEREAEIVAQAGRKGAVTIATNMAGRGTDIVLGGNPEFLAKRDRAASKRRGPGDRRAAEARAIALEERAGGVTRAGARARWSALRRAAHPRHRAPRVPPHRQPAARPLRPPGRPRLLALLPLARRRPDAHLRRPSASQGIMERLGMEEGEPIEHRLVTRRSRSAQKQVEGHNFDIRKHLLEYDDVMNQQREVIYGCAARSSTARARPTR